MRPPDGSPGIEKPFDQSTSVAKLDVVVELPDQTKPAAAPAELVAAADVETLKPLVRFVGYEESPSNVATTDAPEAEPATEARSSK